VEVEASKNEVDRFREYKSTFFYILSLSEAYQGISVELGWWHVVLKYRVLVCV